MIPDVEGHNFSLKSLKPNGEPIHNGEILAFCCARNESLRLPWFLDYHRSLGIDRFLVVDNASTDETQSWLMVQPDVLPFFTDASYASSRCGVDWLNALLDKFGLKHWALTIDVDELLVYPQSERLNLKMLTAYLDDAGADALLTFMLDMYSDKAITDSKYHRGEPFISCCNYFDGDSYFERAYGFLPVRGGPRHRLFWESKNHMKASPVLKKIPLVKWRKDFAYLASTHNMLNVRLAETTGVLQHFKFFSDFIVNSEVETARKEHWDEASQYAIYWNEFQSNDQLSAYYEGSVKFESSSQLLELGLMKTSDDFVRKFG